MKSVVAFLVTLLAVSHAFHVAPAASLTRKTTALEMTVLTYGNKKKDFKEGSPMSVAVKQLGVPVKYSCKK
jgi:hypothetical protein